MFAFLLAIFNYIGGSRWPGQIGWSRRIKQTRRISQQLLPEED